MAHNYVLGSHPAIVTNYEFEKSKNKGTPCVKLVFKFTEGQNEGKFITYRGWLTPNTTERVLQSLRYAGWVGERLEENMPGLGSQKVTLDIQEEENDGNVYARVAWVNQFGGAGKGPKPSDNKIDDEGLDALNAALSNFLLRSEPVEGVKVENSARFIGGGAGDADAEEPLPF